MKRIFLIALIIWLGIPGAQILLLAQGGSVKESYPEHPDSQRKQGVPKGSITKHTFANSKIYPGTTRDYWVYVPAQIDQSKPACLMVFQDGRGVWNDKSSIKASLVFDNLIHTGKMPVTVGVFVNPGMIPPLDPDIAVTQSNRQLEYDAVNGRYADFLLEELLPDALQGLNVSKRPADRGIAGASSGGIAAFNAAWSRSDSFARVYCWVGTFVSLRGGDQLAALVRKTEPKPLRVFLQDGSDDLNTYNGSWWVANQGMLSALKFSGYEVEHVWGKGGHNAKHAGAIMPDAMRWLWKTWPEAPSTHYQKSQHQDLNNVLIEDEKWELIVDDLLSVQGLALAPNGEFFFSDSETSTIYQADPDKNLAAKIWLKHSGGTKGIAFDKEGRLYGCRLDAAQIVRWEIDSQEMVVLAEGVKSDAIVVAHDGSIYFTEARKKSVWCIPPGAKKAFVAADDYSGAHGIALSPDQSFVYASDFQGRIVWSAQRSNNGKLNHNQPFYQVHLPSASADTRSKAGGMCVDRSGWLLVATAMGIQCLEPRGMVHLILPTPPEAGTVNNICFAGDGSTLLISCGDKIYRRRTKFQASVPFRPPLKPEKRRW